MILLLLFACDGCVPNPSMRSARHPVYVEPVNCDGHTCQHRYAYSDDAGWWWYEYQTLDSGGLATSSTGDPRPAPGGTWTLQATAPDAQATLASMVVATPSGVPEGTPDNDPGGAASSDDAQGDVGAPGAGGPGDDNDAGPSEGPGADASGADAGGDAGGGDGGGGE